MIELSGKKPSSSDYSYTLLNWSATVYDPISEGLTTIFDELPSVTNSTEATLKDFPQFI